MKVSASVGQNSIEIVGSGISDGYGLGVDSVSLVRVGTTQNLVVNGGFEVPAENGGWSIVNNIQGWTGKSIEIGWGKIYNSQWTSQICELDGNSNYAITQFFTFDAEYNLVSNSPTATAAYTGVTAPYTLEFDYAIRNTGVTNPATSQANILWNDVVIASLTPSDAAVHHFSQQVSLQVGDNILNLDGAGLSDGYGLGIANVKLTSSSNPTNLIINGDFSADSLGSSLWNVFVGGIKGWKANKAEVGYCYKVYSSSWPNNNQLCIELDADANQRYTQVISASSNLFTAKK